MWKPQDIFMTVDLILEGVLSHLSASDSALFLAILGLSDRKTFQKFTQAIRDLPEHADWINLMLQKGHTVLLVGSDIEVLMERLDSPLEYWQSGRGKQVLRVWLAVGAFGADAELRQRKAKSPTAQYGITPDGDVLWKRPRGGKVLYTNVIPVPGTWPENIFDTSWVVTTIPNESRIEVVGARPQNDPGQTPRLTMCPMSRDIRHATSQRCSYSPDARILRKRAIWTVYDYTVPYIDMRTGHLLFSERLFDKNFEEAVRRWEGKSSFALELDCRCGFVNVLGAAHIIMPVDK